jgi:hypothetical protein
VAPMALVVTALLVEIATSCPPLTLSGGTAIENSKHGVASKRVLASPSKFGI